MRALLQRVTRASVRFPELPAEPERAIGPGLLVLLGCGKGDDASHGEKLAEKIAGLRVFPDERGRFDKSIVDVKGAALVVSQFTLYGDSRKGRRPDFTSALPGPEAEPLYEAFAKALAAKGVPVKTGVFGAGMHVELVNDGPVTLWLDTAAAG